LAKRSSREKKEPLAEENQKEKRPQSEKRFAAKGKARRQIEKETTPPNHQPHPQNRGGRSNRRLFGCKEERGCLT